jgi:hypothetical protein
MALIISAHELSSSSLIGFDDSLGFLLVLVMDGDIYLIAVPFDSIFFGKVVFQGASAKNSAERVREVVYEISLEVLSRCFVCIERAHVVG